MRKTNSNLFRALPLVAALLFCSAVAAEDLIRYQPGSFTVVPVIYSPEPTNLLTVSTNWISQLYYSSFTNDTTYVSPTTIPGGSITMTPQILQTPHLYNSGAYAGAVTIQLPPFNLTTLDPSTLSGYVNFNDFLPWPPPLPDPMLPNYFLGHYGGTVYHLRRGYYVYDGTFSFVVLKNHAYQGKITIDSQTFYFQGKTPADGHIVTFVTNRRTEYVLDVTLVQYGDNSIGCTGTVEQAHAEGQQGWTANLYGKHSR